MTDTPLAKKAMTAQQWAWEFLRRNPDYLNAFQSLAALSPEQLAQIRMLGEEDQQIDENVIRSIGLQFFDMQSMTGYQDSQKTVGEYFDQWQKVRKSHYESVVTLSFAKAFRSTTYSLTRWLEPDSELTASEAASIWQHDVPVEFGLERRSTFDGMMTDFEIRVEMYKSGNLGSLTPDEIASLKTDKRVRKSPIHSIGLSEAFKGVDGRIYSRNRNSKISLERQQVSATFDLRFPIEYQINQIKSLLEQHQNDLVQSGFIKSLPKQADRFGNFSEYLIILDKLNDGLPLLSIALDIGVLKTKIRWKTNSKTGKTEPITEYVSTSKIQNVQEQTQIVRKKIDRALQLRDHGYRALAFLK